ncbi:hypothetical protein ACQ4PT_025053 [Festuca glaucescens]
MLELLLRGDGASGGGGSRVHEKPSLTDHHEPPPPSSSALPTHYTAGNPSGKETPSEAEMASWLCEVFHQEPEGGNAVPSTSDDDRAGAAGYLRTASVGTPTSGAAECRPRRRRSCSGKAVEQRRRDKINDKLRTLQQLTPCCSKGKTDKASTLEEVIKYVKSLQHQVQVMSANGYAIPTTIRAPPCMQLPAGDVLGGRPPPVMLPQYPVFPMVYACPHNATPAPMSMPCTRRHPVEPAGSSSGGRWQLAPRRHLVADELTVPTAEPQLREMSEITYLLLQHD